MDQQTNHMWTINVIKNKILSYGQSASGFSLLRFLSELLKTELNNLIMKIGVLKTKMPLLSFLLVFFLFSEPSGICQSSKNENYQTELAHFKLQPFKTYLSDEELRNFQIRTMLLESAPGQKDTVTHRHDCEILVTVLTGTIEITQNYKTVTLHAGQSFLETRNAIHSLVSNPDTANVAKLLLVYIIKDGRSDYERLYAPKVNRR